MQLSVTPLFVSILSPFSEMNSGVLQRLPRWLWIYDYALSSFWHHSWELRFRTDIKLKLDQLSVVDFHGCSPEPVSVWEKQSSMLHEKAYLTFTQKTWTWQHETDLNTGTVKWLERLMKGLIVMNILPQGNISGIMWSVLFPNPKNTYTPRGVYLH